jgi:hypothetical protein
MSYNESTRNDSGNSPEFIRSLKAGRWTRGGSRPTNHRPAILLRATVIAAFALAVLTQSTLKTRQVYAAAPTISGVAYLLNVGPTDVSITWSTLDEQSDSYVDYGTTSDYGQIYYYQSPSTYHGASLVGLTPSTTYHFRIRATGSISGNVTYTDDYAFTTLDPRPPTISAVDRVSNIHVSDATITWQTQDEASDTHMDWGTTTNYGQVYSDSSSNTSHQVALSGLAAGTTYHLRIRATGSTSGNINYSHDYSFTTQAPTGPIISGVSYLLNVGVRDVSISWRTLNEESDSYVEYGTTTSYGLVYNYPSSAIYHGATLSNLTPNTTYHFRIRATGVTSGLATYSDDYSFTTKPSPSPTITSVSYLSNIGETDAGITWSTLDEESDSYVDYGTTTSYGLVYNYPSPSNYHGATFLHLSPSTTYHFRIKATGSTTGNVTYSDDYSFTTKAPAAPVISAVAYLPNVGVTDISITWSTLNEESDSYVDYGTSTNYGLVYNYPSPSVYHGANLSGLTPSTTYHFRIKATGATSGHVSYSDDYVFTTKDPPPPPPPPRDPLYQQNLQRAQAVALAPSDRPKQFIISDLIIGPATTAQPLVNPQTLDDAVQTLALLGINTPQIESFGQLDPQIETVARNYGMSRFRGGVSAPYGPGYWTWQTGYFTPTSVDQWAANLANQYQNVLHVSPADVALFHTADEPTWYYPDVFSDMNANPSAVAMFQQFLQSKGLQPADVGAADWSTVHPIGRSQAVDLPSRRLFYWSARFAPESMSDGMRILQDALKRHFNPNIITTSDWNNNINKFYVGSPNAPLYKGQSAGPDTARGGPDWMDFGRKASVGATWTEYWFQDRDSKYAGYYADAVRSAAEEGGTTCGAYVVGLSLTQGPSGGRYKGLATLAHGCKVLEWYVNGPEERFPGNGYSNYPEAYRQIADANRLIARSEDLLYPGRPLKSKVAMFMSGSSNVWDTPTAAVAATSGRDYVYQAEMDAAYFALSHQQFNPINFLDETNLAHGDLTNRGYSAIYVTSPNMSSAAQTALRSWIQAGGVAYFSPGAAAADEYNTPAHILDDARGLVSGAIQGRAPSEDTSLRTRISFLNALIAGNVPVALPNDVETVSRQTVALQLTTATPVARYDDGSVAMAANNFGNGIAVSAGFWGASAYYDSSFSGGAPLGHLPSSWSPSLREIVTATARAANMQKPVELSQEVVEAARLDSAGGVAVTLLNWTDTPINSLTVTVHNVGTVTSVQAADSGASLAFTQSGSDVTVTIPLATVDVLKLYVSH